MKGSVTFGEMRDFISKFTLVDIDQIAPASRLMRDLFFDRKDGPSFMEAFSSHFHVDIATCQMGQHFDPHPESRRRGLFLLICLIPTLFIIIRYLLRPNLSMQVTGSQQIVLGIIVVLNVSVFVLICALLKARKSTGSEEWRPHPPIDLSVGDLVEIADAGAWPQAMYEKKAA